MSPRERDIDQKIDEALAGSPGCETDPVLEDLARLYGEAPGEQEAKDRVRSSLGMPAAQAGRARFFRRGRTALAAAVLLAGIGLAFLVPLVRGPAVLSANQLLQKPLAVGANETVTHIIRFQDHTSGAPARVLDVTVELKPGKISRLDFAGELLAAVFGDMSSDIPGRLKVREGGEIFHEIVNDGERIVSALPQLKLATVHPLGASKILMDERRELLRGLVLGRAFEGADLEETEFNGLPSHLISAVERAQGDDVWGRWKKGELVEFRLYFSREDAVFLRYEVRSGPSRSALELRTQASLVSSSRAGVGDIVFEQPPGWTVWPLEGSLAEGWQLRYGVSRRDAGAHELNASGPLLALIPQRKGFQLERAELRTYRWPGKDVEAVALLYAREGAKAQRIWVITGPELPPEATAVQQPMRLRKAPAEKVGSLTVDLLAAAKAPVWILPPESDPLPPEGCLPASRSARLVVPFQGGFGVVTSSERSCEGDFEPVSSEELRQLVVDGDLQMAQRGTELFDELRSAVGVGYQRMVRNDE